MITKNIDFKNFDFKKNSKSIKNDLRLLIKKNDMVFQSLGSKYKNNYKKKIILNVKKYQNVRIIGMGGSILGTESIYEFLRHKIKKNFSFINNLTVKKKN